MDFTAMISIRKIQREKLKDKDIKDLGYKPNCEEDRCHAQIEDLLKMSSSCDEQPSATDSSKTPQHQLWNKVWTYLEISKYWTSTLSRYWTSDMDSNKDRIQENGCNTLVNQQEEVPKAWLDMMDKSNMFPGKGAHYLHKCFGIKDFVVFKAKCEISISMGFSFIKQLSKVAFKSGCHLPVFVKCDKTFYLGFLEYCGFRTFFRVWEVSKTERLKGCQLNMNNLERIKYNLAIDDYKFQNPVKVSTLSYYMDIRESHKGCDLTSTDDFDGSEDYWCDNNIRLYLNATWSSQMKTAVTGCGIDLDLDPLKAPEWSVAARIAEKPGSPLGDFLKKFLSLCSMPISKKRRRKCISRKRVLKKTMDRKILSKPTLKLEHSIISAKSLNVILNFLFHNGKVEPFQHPNGSNPSISTIVEDEAEDKFYLSCKEQSKFFKPSSLISRLAICLCIVNEHHGGLKAIKHLWSEFVLRMKYCLENNCEIKGLEPHEQQLDNSELLQMLQVLSYYIEKKSRVESSLITWSECIDEDEEGASHEVKRRKTSDGLRRVFAKRRINFDGDAKKALHWLAVMEPSDLVLRLVPLVIHSAASTLLKHPMYHHLGLLGKDLDEFRKKLLKEYCNKIPWLTSDIKILEDYIHHLTLLEQKIATAHCLLKKFRHVDPSIDADLREYVSDLVEFRHIPIKTPKGELPSSTSFGKLLCNLFEINYEQREGKSGDTGMKGLGQHFKEFNYMLDCSKTTGLRLRLRCTNNQDNMQFSVSYIDENQLPCWCWDY